MNRTGYGGRIKHMRDRRRLCLTCRYRAKVIDTGGYVCVHASVFDVTAILVPIHLDKRYCKCWEPIEEG